MMLNTAKEIGDWLNQQNVKNYRINANLSVDVRGDVRLSHRSITVLPLSFNEVFGEFDCSNCQLTTLKGAPKKVSSNFFCQHNDLSTLEFAPQHVGGSFDCSFNRLKNLQFAPDLCFDFFMCSGNLLDTLEFCPIVRTINFSRPLFSASNNPGLGQYQQINDATIIRAEAERIQTVLREQQQLSELLRLRPQSTASFKL